MGLYDTFCFKTRTHKKKCDEWRRIELFAKQLARITSRETGSYFTLGRILASESKTSRFRIEKVLKIFEGAAVEKIKIKKRFKYYETPKSFLRQASFEETERAFMRVTVKKLGVQF